LLVNKVLLGGVNAGDFAETDTCGDMLSASASCVISITFTPTMKGWRQSGIGISTSDPGSPNAIPMGGTGTVVSLSAFNLAFEDEAVAIVSPSQTLMLTNTASTPLNISNISITGTNAGDFLQSNTCGTGIGAKASCNVTVKFKPTAIGKR